MYSDAVLDEIKANINIVDLVSKYVTLKKVGRNYQGLCPFHAEKTPSFFVNPNLGICKCFGCGKGGDIFKFLQEIEKLTFREAVEKLAKQAGVDLPKSNKDEKLYKEKQLIKKTLDTYSKFFHKLLFTSVGKNALSYMTNKRKLSVDFLKKYLIGYAPYDTKIILDFAKIIKVDKEILLKAGLLTDTYESRFKNRIMFPLLDNTGQVIGFSGRTLSNNPNVPKYLNTPETTVFHKRFNLFGIYFAKTSISKKDMAILTEGQMDVLSSFKEGVLNIVAPLGTALTDTQLILLKRFTQNIAFAFDNDSAGQKALIRSVIMALRQGFVPYVIKLPSTVKDIDEFITKYPGKWQVLADKPIEFFKYSFEKLKKIKDTHYTQVEPFVDELLEIIVYAPELRSELLLKELADILGVSVSSVMQKYEIFKKRIEQANRYSNSVYNNTRSNGKNNEYKNTYKKDSSASADENEGYQERAISIEQETTSISALDKQAYNLEKYITLLILHYPPLSLTKGLMEKYTIVFRNPEFKALIKLSHDFLLKQLTELKKKDKKEFNNIQKDMLDLFDYFEQNWLDKFSQYLKKKTEDSPIYEDFLEIAVLEPPYSVFDQIVVKDFYKTWLRLQKLHIKREIIKTVEELDVLENSDAKVSKKDTKNTEETIDKKEKYIKQLTKDLEQIEKQITDLNTVT